MAEDRDVLDWDDMSEADKARAQELLNELNEIFNHYPVEKEDGCEDSTSND